MKNSSEKLLDVPSRDCCPRARGSEEFLDAIRRFDSFGTPTVTRQIADIPYFINEFWDLRTTPAHSLHEISYRACFKPQLPEFFIERLTASGDVVLDPFMGRGTTPLQAALMGRRPFGNDINPLSTLLTRPRLSPPPLAAIRRRLQQIPWDDARDVPPDLLAFYHPTTLRHLCALREWLLREAPLQELNPDPATDWIRMIAINRLTGHSPGFFSVYTLPPNQAASVANQRRINAARGQHPPERDIPSLILRKTEKLLRDGAPKRPDGRCLCTAPATAMAHIQAASVALVVTSPPFLDIVQYAQDNWLRGWFAGIDPAGIAIAMHRTEAAWEVMVRDVLRELVRILRPGAHIAFEVGEVRGGKILLEQAVWRAADNLPLDRLAVLVNQQNFTKTANCWGIENNAKGTNTNASCCCVGSPFKTEHPRAGDDQELRGSVSRTRSSWGSCPCPRAAPPSAPHWSC